MSARRIEIVKNTSPFDDFTIRRLVYQTALRECDPGELPVIRIYAARTKKWTVRGEAELRGRNCWLWFNTTVSIRQAAVVVRHEIAHLRGKEHPTMRGSSRYYEVGAWQEQAAWADAFPLRVRERAAAPPKRTAADKAQAHADRKADAVTRALKTRDKWIAAAAHAETMRRKWEVEVTKRQRALRRASARATEARASGGHGEKD